ncbi:MAG: YHS domain-containing protein [Deltaproteobacteria bacterium]|nr:YHS domain-containing protein [Deltaproteobacteria bacterium]
MIENRYFHQEVTAMLESKKLSQEIKKRLKRSQEDKNQRLLQVAIEMKQQLKQREYFNNIAGGIFSSVVYSRMRELSKHFENSTLPDLSEIENMYCVCQFSHTRRFPATVNLGISFSSGEDFENIVVHYNLEILPMLMKFNRHDERRFLLTPLNRDEIGDWLDTKILEFVDTYLQLETHPFYQKENYVVDPVCGMRFPLIEAVDKIDREGETIYFCSEACKKSYLKKYGNSDQPNSGGPG